MKALVVDDNVAPFETIPANGTAGITVRTGDSGSVTQVLPSTLDLGTINPGPATFVFTVAGVAPGDVGAVNPTPALDDNIAVVQYHVSGAGTVQVILFNLSGAPIVVGVQTFLFGIFKA